MDAHAINLFIANKVLELPVYAFNINTDNAACPYIKYNQYGYLYLYEDDFNHIDPVKFTPSRLIEDALPAAAKLAGKLERIFRLDYLPQRGTWIAQFTTGYFDCLMWVSSENADPAMAVCLAIIEAYKCGEERNDRFKR